MRNTAVFETNDKKTKKVFSEENIQILEIKDVIYVESEGHYLHTYMVEGQMIIRSKVKEFIEGIEEVFLHSHQSFAVNMAYIKKFGNNEIELKDGRKIPVSRSKFKESKEKLIKYLDG